MPSPLPPLPRRRIASVDAFRGLTFLLMLFVNVLAEATGIPYGIGHMAAGVDGMGLADVVFPAFMFAVGMSLPFSLQARVAKGDGWWLRQRHIAARAAGLIVLGFFMVNTEEGYNERAMGLSIELWALAFYAAALLVWGVYRCPQVWQERVLRGTGIAAIAVLALLYRGGEGGHGWMTPQWWGILGCIGWAYLVACFAYQLARGKVAPQVLAMGGCVAWFALSQAWQGSEVLAMHATHSSIVLAGVLCSVVVFDGARADNARSRLSRLALLGGGLALAGWLLHHAYPISKIGATPPWALYCAALCCAGFGLLYWLVEHRRRERWTTLVEPAAANPLITYLLPIVLATLMHWLRLRWWPPLTDGAGAFAFAALFACGVIAVVAVLNTYNFKLKL
jgi:predicted acyltransferase